jgi:hypothetical protein
MAFRITRMSDPEHQSDDTDAELGQKAGSVWIAPHSHLAAMLLMLAQPVEGEQPGRARFRHTVALEVVLRWLGPDGLLEAHRIAQGSEPLAPFVHESAREAADALGKLRHSDRAAFAELMERLSTIPAPPIPEGGG